MRRFLHLAAFIALITACLTFSCGKKGTQPQEDTRKPLPDTLVVGTLYSPTSYFLYKGDLMGYNYDLINRFANDKGVVVRFEVMRSMASLIEKLDSAEIDIIAYNTPITAEFKDKMLHCGLENITTQVLIQPLKDGKPEITDVTQLVGKDIFVEKNSKYESRLRNLDNEIGGGIKIHPLERDTLMSEDLIEMVAKGQIPLTIVDSDIAQLDHTYYSNIDISLEVSFPQRSAWAVSKGDKWLADSIDAWAIGESIILFGKNRFNHYFKSNKRNSALVQQFNFKKIRSGEISPYDEFFKESSKIIGWDWRLLAAQCYVESGFNPNVVSWAGARGVMQLMPSTARSYGLDESTVADPKLCIHAAARCIRDLDKYMAKYIEDPAERKRFILASYNSGMAHIIDAIALARKYGKNPQLWYGNVEDALLMKSKPEYYNDEVCKYGYFRGRQTVSYVEEVERVYEVFCQ